MQPVKYIHILNKSPVVLRYLYYLIGFLAYVLLQSLACSKSNEMVPITRETEHFILITNSDASTDDEINGILERAEGFFLDIHEILGQERAPSSKITILLEGDFIDQGPYFDTAGIHLFRYSVSEDGYYAALAHELVHAFRVNYYIEYDPWSWPIYPYLDEGFAEHIAQIVDPGKTGFPWYGYDSHAVVGDLILSGQFIPHHILRERHDEFNQPCHIQTYTIRTSWQNYIDEKYGRDALLTINYPEQPPTEDFFIEILGDSLATIDAQWKEWALEKFEETPGAEEIVAGFRERTSWYEFCEY